MKIKTVILLFFLALAACQSRNKLNTDEQKLAAQIASDENEKQAAEEALSQNVSEIPDSLPPGFRFQEDRSVDPKKPPILLDVLGTKQNSREFKLSDVASSIKYVKLETPSGPIELWNHPKLDRSSFDFFSDSNNVFVQGLFGLARFNMAGSFQELIWKNVSGVNGLNFSPREFYGILQFNPVSTFNNNIYIRFLDGNNRQTQIVKQKIQDKQVLSISLKNVESQPDIIAGNKLFTIKDNTSPFKYQSIFGLSESCWGGVHDTYMASETGAVITVFNNNGDTLCLFSSANQVKNRTHPRVAANKPLTWYFKDNLTFMEQYSDTIFRIVPPNRMLPVFILDFGKDKVSFHEGLNPNTDLAKKLLPYTIFETDNYLFIRYTNNSVGLLNLRNKTVKFHNSIFVKSENQFYHFPEQSLTEKNMQNDLDGGISFWPEFITPEGKMLMMVSGKMMKEYINSNDFKSNTMSEEQRQKQIGMANALADSDKLVVMVN